MNTMIRLYGVRTNNAFMVASFLAQFDLNKLAKVCREKAEYNMSLMISKWSTWTLEYVYLLSMNYCKYIYIYIYS